MENIVGVIQVRMGSTRLPGKALMEIQSKPLLYYLIDRIKQSILIDDVVIATTISSKDDVIESFANEYDIKFYRGSESDVLQRIVDTLKYFNVDIHVEFMGDNPIPDPLLVDSIIGFFLKNKHKYDYVTNAMKTTFPPGFEVSVYYSDTLFQAEKLAKDKKLREHVGIHIFQNPNIFRVFNVEAHKSIKKYSNLHFEVDTIEDFEVLKAVIEHFYPEFPCFSMLQVIQFLSRNPELKEKNSNIQRRWEKFRLSE